MKQRDGIAVGSPFPGAMRIPAADAGVGANVRQRPKRDWALSIICVGLACLPVLLSPATAGELRVLKKNIPRLVDFGTQPESCFQVSYISSDMYPFISGHASTDIPGAELFDADYRLRSLLDSHYVFLRLDPQSLGPCSGNVVFTGGGGAVVEYSTVVQKPLPTRFRFHAEGRWGPVEGSISGIVQPPGWGYVGLTCTVQGEAVLKSRDMPARLADYTANVFSVTYTVDYQAGKQERIGSLGVWTYIAELFQATLPRESFPQWWARAAYPLNEYEDPEIFAYPMSSPDVDSPSGARLSYIGDSIHLSGQTLTNVLNCCFYPPAGYALPDAFPRAPFHWDLPLDLTVVVTDVSPPVRIRQIGIEHAIEVKDAPAEIWPQIGILADKKSEAVALPVVIDCGRGKPPWTPVCEYEWSWPPVSDTGRVNLHDTPGGWSGPVVVSSPEGIGTYPLELTVTVLNDAGGELDECTIVRPFLITWDMPRRAVDRRIWIEKAVKWGGAGLSTTVPAVLSGLNFGIRYSGNDWRYEDTKLHDGRVNEAFGTWEELLDGRKSEGNCVSYADMWDNLAKVLGVATGTEGEDGLVGRGFVTNWAQALDGKGGNFIEYGTRFGWLFGYHRLGSYYGTYWDPTFWNKWNGPRRKFIRTDILDKWAEVGDFICLQTTNGLTVVLRKPMPGSRTWYDHEVVAGSGARTYHTSSRRASAGTDILESHDLVPSDRNGDGLFEEVRLEGVTRVLPPGSYTLWGGLQAGDAIVTTRSSKYATESSALTFSSAGAGESVELGFSGEDVFRSGADGTYNVLLILNDGEGNQLGHQVIFSNDEFRHTDFGEVPRTQAITAIKCAGADIDLSVTGLVTGQTYAVETTSCLESNDWRRSTQFLAVSDSTTRTEAVGTEKRMFYRIVAE